ncbi:MAG: response regulator [Desulfobacteraceae bacterium]|nr:response regulator [Desulfobacteraceae bacterium]
MAFHPIDALRRSFRAKVILISIFFMLITCLSLTGFFVYHQSASLNASLVERGGLLVRVLAHSARVGIFAENPELLENPVDGIARQKEVARVMVYNANGDLIYASADRQGASGPSDANSSQNADIGEQLYEKLSASDSTVCFSSPDALQVWSGVFSVPDYAGTEALFFEENKPPEAKKVIGFIHLKIRKEKLNSQVYGFLFKSGLIAVLATAVASGLIFLVINNLMQPLNRLGRAIKALGEEDAAETIPVDTEDEIGRLAIAFNELSGSLRKRRAENFQLEMQLRQAQKLEALGTLSGGIAHDFNNVLSPIFGYTEMALEEIPENDRLYNNLQQVLQAAERARELVRQILAFSRQGESRRRPLHVQVVIKEALKLLRASLPSTIAITEEIDESCGPVFADPTNIHRIVMNLATNAYHAMQAQGGELKVALGEETLTGADISRLSLDLVPGRYVKLTMSDTGSGMDDETLQRIFDPYFTTKPLGEGTGMGLAMVHGIVKGCSADIRVRSKPGKGTLFQIYFPRAESDTDPDQYVESPLTPSGHEHILLVDDEVQVAQMLKQMLEHLGYCVTLFTDSRQALEDFAARPEAFDLIITDQTMPHMTGEDLAEEALRLHTDIPVILCTGFSEKITEEKAKSKGIRAFLMKPVLRQKMAETLRVVLDHSEK